MQVINHEVIDPSSHAAAQTGKFIVNDKAIVFFAATHQHNSIRLAGLSYEDDYLGNAMAGTFKLGRVDVRFHRDFSDERVRTIWSDVCAQPELKFLKDWDAFYQGRPLKEIRDKS